MSFPRIAGGLLRKLIPRLNFIRLHYVWIVFCSLLAFPVLYSYGNLTPIDALFFGCSASTESGLNTVDVKDLKTYQQVYIYVIPVITNLMFINALVVVVRLYWFRKRIGGAARAIRRNQGDAESAASPELKIEEPSEEIDDDAATVTQSHSRRDPNLGRNTTITFSDHNGQHRAAGYSGPADEQDPDAIKAVRPRSRSRNSHRLSLGDGAGRNTVKSFENIASSAFVLGPRPTDRSEPHRSSDRVTISDLPQLSKQVTVGRNSNFYNLSEADREKLGGIEYLALKMLAKFVFGYLLGLHLLGVICLLPWIHRASSKYTNWLEECGVGKTWWAFYSAQTMVDNLGFTLTPDSMATFKDATWPMIIMAFLAFAGNTLYPVLLRLTIWVTSKLIPKGSSSRETIQFLLDHPRRCYVLLFPSNPTWILFGIVFLLNFIDVVLIVALDLDNPAVNDLPIGPRILSALFQAASSRHTGTATLNLAQVNPGVQFSLLTMMYIAIFPIAISIRASNTDEERSLGIFAEPGELDEKHGMSYVMSHVRNQLSFDLWYIFVGTFLVCVTEAERIMNVDEPSFSVFAVLFEVTSAYGNVGLSLGGPSGSVSMVGHYSTIGKFVICAMMIRGRHRGLPYALDRAINLPVEHGTIRNVHDDDNGGEHGDYSHKLDPALATNEDGTLKTKQ